MNFELVEDKERYKAKIKVIGIGGAGGNAINNMISSRLRGVDFVAMNTDCQDLDRSLCSHKIQLGPSITMGLGSGADPQVGKLSAEESIDEIQETIDEYDMVFLTAGMGGGTGTGATPVVARESKESNALTVAVVTKPFKFEGDKRMKRAIEGIQQLRNEADTLIVIPNERLKNLGSRSATFKNLIAQADEVLLQAVKGISDLIMSNGFINLDFADVKKVMGQMGTAIMGTGRAGGENRASEAAEKAINSPLLEDISVNGAKGLLMNITGPSDMTMDEIDEASSYIKEEVHPDAEIFWGVVLDDDMENEVQVTIIATGIDSEDYVKKHSFGNVVKIRPMSNDEAQEDWVVRKTEKSLDIPTWKRDGVDIMASEEEDGTRQAKRDIPARFNFMDDLDYPTFLRALDD
ncbi:MAG: cell division protein FtsZ [Deltaproteobacteria bacterium]|nr:cell division protein FtsZ [Deltaproteobacteria bacterium]